MLTVNKLLPQGRGLAAVLLKRATSVELDWDVRQKSRFDAVDSGGRTLGVFLPRGTAVRGGDVLVAEDGSLVRVVAQPQPVMVVRHCTEHGTPFDLVRAAYHLGNRHVALELQPDHLKLEPDPVLAAMLRQMHLIVADATLAFEPEGGAYAAAPAAAQGGHGHGHGHEHEHGHGQRHGQEAHAHGHAHESEPVPSHHPDREQPPAHRHEPERQQAHALRPLDTHDHAGHAGHAGHDHDHASHTHVPRA